MAIKGGAWPTFLDVASTKDPSGNLAKVIEPLARYSPVIESGYLMEGNSDIGHVVTTQTALPANAWRRYNEGVTPTKAAFEQFIETCGMLAGVAKVDASLAEMAPGGPLAFRATMAKGFMEKMAQDLERAFWYESLAISPQKIHGLTPRYAASGSTRWTVGKHVIKCLHAGTAAGANQNSMWLLVWSDTGIALMHPKGSKAGYDERDMGLELTSDGAGGEFPAWRSWHEWKLGVVVNDFAQACRICNIDPDVWAVGDLAIRNSMIRALNTVRSLRSGRAVFYCNRTVEEWIERECLEATKNTLTQMDWGGRSVPSFRGVPILVTDGLDENAEALVS